MNLTCYTSLYCEILVFFYQYHTVLEGIVLNEKRYTQLYVPYRSKYQLVLTLLVIGHQIKWSSRLDTELSDNKNLWKGKLEGNQTNKKKLFSLHYFLIFHLPYTFLEKIAWTSLEI